VRDFVSRTLALSPNPSPARGRGELFIAFAVLLALPHFASAQTDAGQNSDLDLIPQSVLKPQAEAQAAPRGGGRFYLEDAFTRAWLHSDLAVALPSNLPQTSGYTWQNRSSFDALDQWTLAPHLIGSLSDRFNLFEESDFDLDSSQTASNDLREAYLTWEPAERRYLEAGRINLREGVALGFNPTDFFRARTQVAQASLDPSALRENRLGSFMLRAQSIWNGGSASLVYAPQLESPRPLQEPPPIAFNPQIDRTNGDSRLMATLSWELLDLSPQLLLFHEGSQTRYGLDLSHTVGQSIVAYAEWAGGRQLPEAAQAVAFAERTGGLPPDLPPLPGGSDKSFRNDASVGASWTSAAKVTLNLEFHYHQAGFSNDQWHSWFADGAAAAGQPVLLDGLWFIRAYASDRQDSLTRRRIFFRADWADAFVERLELSGFALVDNDGSTLAQASASYSWSDHWSSAAYLTGYFGGPRTEFGSLPQRGSATISVTRYF
jgi:hypothetical protein